MPDFSRICQSLSVFTSSCQSLRCQYLSITASPNPLLQDLPASASSCQSLSVLV
jgi:hypothetical protein